MKKIFTLLLAMLLVFGLVACGGNNAAENNNNAAETNTVNESTNTNNEATEEEETEEVNMRPFVAGSADFNGDFYAGWTNSTYDKNIRQLVWGFGLMTDNVAGEIIDSPLVEEKTVSDDLTEWTFKIKEGVKFHNGEELTVSDIKFTYEFYMDKEPLAATGGSSSMEDYIESIAIDEAANTITFTLKKVIFTTDMSVFYETWILAEDTITDGAAAAGQNVHEYVKTNINAPVGYGPYIFAEYKESEYVRLKVNPDYIGEAPAIQEIIVKVTPSETELDQLLQGEVDLLGRTVEAEKIEAAKESDMLTTNNYFRHGGGTMILHSDYEAFALTEVRQAFAYVFNRPKVIELFLGEYGIASQGPYSKNQWMMYDEDEKALIGTAAIGKFESTLTNYDILDADGKFDEEANIAKAQELLDAAVAKTEGEYANLTGDRDSGYMWKGERLEIKITYTAFWSDTYNLVWNDEYISKLGFDVTLHGLDWPVMYGHWTGNTTEERQYHAYVGGMGYSIKSNPKSGYSSERILEWGQPSDNGSRFTGGSTYTTEEWDQLLLDIENSHPITGAESYKKLWREFIRTMNAEVPIIPVYSNNYHDLYSSDLENFTTNALWAWPRAILDANWK
jgi:ABC-type transport system substrate-binding protein